MPTYFEFKKNVTLKEFKREVRKWVEEREDLDINDSFIVVSAMNILDKYGRISELNIEHYCDKYHGGKYKECLNKFLIKEYTFETWQEK